MAINILVCYGQTVYYLINYNKMSEKISPKEKAGKLAIKFCTPLDSVIPNRRSIQNAIKCVEELLVENNMYDNYDDLELTKTLISRHVFLEQVGRELELMLKSM